MKDEIILKPIDCISNNNNINTIDKTDGTNLEKKNEGCKTKFTFRQIVIISFIGFGIFCTGAVATLQGPFFPKEAESKGATPTEYGIVQNSLYITIFLGAPIFGKILSRFGRPKFFLLFGGIGVGLSTMAFGLLTYSTDKLTFIVLSLALRLTEGFFASIFRTCTYAIGSMQNAERTASILSFLRIATGVGLMIGPMIGGVLFDIGGFKLPFLVMGSSFLINSAAIFFVLPSEEKENNAEKKTKGVLKFWLNAGTILYFMITFVNYIVYGHMLVTLEPHLRQFELSGFYLGLVFSVNGILVCIVAPLTGMGIDKYNCYSFFVLNSIVSLILYLMLVGPMAFLHLESKLWISIVALVFFGFGTSMTMIATLIGLVDHSVSRGYAKDLETYGFSSSVSVSSRALGLFVGSSAGGYLFEKLGFDGSSMVLFYIEILLLVVTSVFMIWKKVIQQREKK